MQPLVEIQNTLLKSYQNQAAVQIHFQNKQRTGMVAGIIDMELYFRITDEKQLTIPIKDITKVVVLD